MGELKLKHKVQRSEMETATDLGKRPKRPRHTWLWIVLLIIILIVGGIAAFEMGRSSSRGATQTASSSEKQSDNSAKESHTTKKSADSSSTSSSSSSVSASSSSKFQMNYQNTSAAGWNNAAVYYGAHALGYSEIIPDLDQGSYKLSDGQNDNGDESFTYQFGSDRNQLNQAVYMQFTFTDKQINYYDNTSPDTPVHTVSLQQVLDYINAQDAGQQVENLNCNFTN